tara:strand:+ start:494 stop:994 length:501 start_codon:yes stop_codon:yes gene_type:complete
MEKNLNDSPNSNSAEDKKLENKEDFDLKTITKRFYAAAVLHLKARMKKIIAATEDITRTTYLVSQFFVVMSFVFLCFHLANYLDYRNTFLAKFIDYSLPTTTIGFLIMNLVLSFFCIIYLKYKFKYSNGDIENIRANFTFFWGTFTYILYISFIGVPIFSFISNIF